MEFLTTRSAFVAAIATDHWRYVIWFIDPWYYLYQPMLMILIRYNYLLWIMCMYDQMSNYSSMDGILYCKTHFEQLFKESGSFTKNFQTSKKDLLNRTFISYYILQFSDLFFFMVCMFLDFFSVAKTDLVSLCHSHSLPPPPLLLLLLFL